VPTIASFLGDDHHRCDDLFVEAERLAAGGEPGPARAAHTAFAQALTRHFAMEEAVVFPAFEESMGGAGGPTTVMRREHGQMRELCAAMDQALAAADGDGFLAASETLLVLMQQHNAKEEQILYPMLDRALRERETLITRMESVAAEAQ
jgi:iron-sulfur cluster repair protein YtfE (RIC family)